MFVQNTLIELIILVGKNVRSKKIIMMELYI